MQVNIVTDDYPEETGWTIRNASSQIVARANAGDFTTAGQLFTTSVTLESPGQYTFTITDEYSDGMCCDYGSGSYELKVGSTVLASGGEFGGQESKGFQV